jgi:quercetin dioxygenase-like cupin family protein
VPFFWTEQRDFDLGYIGHGECWDAAELDGQLDAGTRHCTITYRRDGKTLAVAVVQRDFGGSARGSRTQNGRAGVPDLACREDLGCHMNMNPSNERLRPHPSTRLTGPVVPLRLAEVAAALQAESHPATNGHRQVGLIHRGALRLVLFTFEVGGRLPEHRASGHVVLHCLRGELAIDVVNARHRLASGEVLVLDPDVAHAVEALVASEMLLTVCLS